MARYNITYAATIANQGAITVSGEGVLSVSESESWVKITNPDDGNDLLVAVPAHLVLCVMKVTP